MERLIREIVAQELGLRPSEVGVLRGENCTIILVDRLHSTTLSSKLQAKLREEIEVARYTNLGIVRLLEGSSLS